MTRYGLLLSVAALAGAAAPRAAWGDGNASALVSAPLRSASVAAGFDLKRRWLRGAAQARRTPRQAMVPFGPGAQAECVASVGSLTLDFTKLEAKTTSKVTLKSTTSALGDIYVYVEEFSSGSLKVADKDGPLPAADTGYGVFLVTLRQALAYGETIDLTFTQAGKPECKPSEFLNLQTCMLTSALIYNVSGAWQPSIYDVYAGLLDCATSTLEVTLPSSMKVAVSGLDAGSKTNTDGTTTHTYSATTQGGFGLAAGGLVSGSTPFGAGQEARSFVLSPHDGYALGWRQAAADIISFHAQRYGSYDLPKIDIAEVSDAAGAAYGPLSTVFIPTTLWTYDPGQWAYRATLAHELGHQWFAGFIAQDDPYSPWLSEGFATFAEMQYTIAEGSKALGVDYGPAYRALVAQEYIYTVRTGKDVPMTSQAIYQAPSEIYVAVTYSKGGLVVNMLRYLAGGDAPFFAAVRKYRQDHVGKKATAQSLAASLGASTGKDLTCFLTRWVQSPGYPVFSVDVRRAATGVDVTVTSDKEPCLPLEVDFITADGKTSRRTLTLSGVKGTMRFAGDSEVLQVRLDPDRQIVGRTLGALSGDIALDGEVDGIDLIYAAWAQGNRYDPQHYTSSANFPDWADLSFDGSIDSEDLDVVLGAFGTSSGQGG